MKSDKLTTLLRLEKLDTQFQSLLRIFDAYSPSELAKRKSEDSWSVLEVLQHLSFTEKSSFGYIKHKISKGDTLKDTGLVHILKTHFMVRFFKSSIKVKAPNFPGLDPIGTDLDYQKVKAEWITTRKDMHSFLKKLDDRFFKNAIFKHPLTGRINIRQTIDFYEVHIERHYKQIEEILASKIKQ